MLTTLLQKTESTGLSDDAIIDNLKTFFFAGFDTTAITLSYALYSLSLHREWIDKIVEEVRGLLEIDPTAPRLADRLRRATYEDITAMKFTTAVVKETLRLYPSAQITTRHLEKPITLSGITLPKGAAMVIPIWWIHRSPHNWKDPDEFRPQRFLVDKVDGKAGRRANSEGAHPYAWIPFSGGQCNCVGQRFAMLEAVAALGALVYHLDFTYASDQPVVSVTTSFVQKPRDGIPMRVRARVHSK